RCPRVSFTCCLNPDLPQDRCSRDTTPVPYTTLFRSGRRARHHVAPDPRLALYRLEARGRQARGDGGGGGACPGIPPGRQGPRGKDRKSTRLNSSHVKISYAVFCLKKKTRNCRDGTRK